MKTQLLGICVSLAVHGIIAFLLFTINQGFSPGTRTRVIGLSFEAAGPMGNGGSPDEEKTPFASDSEPMTGSPAPSPLQTGETQLSKHHPSPKTKSPEQKKALEVSRNR